MLPDRVSNPGPLTHKSGALPIALRGPTEETQENYRMRYFVENVAENVSFVSLKIQNHSNDNAAQLKS